MSAESPSPLLPRHDYHMDDGNSKAAGRSDATTGASAAGMRAVTARLAAFYFRVPVKAFFRTRVDYLAYPRAINPLFQNGATQRWSWQMTSPAILAHAVRQYGWSFIPNQVLPPLLANVTIGAVLYTSYLQFLSLYHGSGAASTKRIYPPPSFASTMAAGMSAGAIQSVIAAPLDALTIRFHTSDLLEKRYKTMWHYAYHKIKSIGTRGAYAGASLSLFKDSLSAGIFFSTFETVKSQAFYAFVRRFYMSDNLSIRQQDDLVVQGLRSQRTGQRPIIRPYYLIEPGFLMLAGAVASVSQQVILHPLNQIQEVHYRRLAGLDAQLSQKPSRATTLHLYGQSYIKTLKQCMVHARRVGGWRRWLFTDFWMSTLRQLPSTSAGLIVFEIFRRKYGIGSDAVKIRMDGYDILLP